MDDTTLVDAVADTLREVAAAVVMPRWRNLTDGDVSHKAGGDVVTIADTEAESRLTAALTKLVAGSVVVGEEGVADDPKVLTAARSAQTAWIIDPVDGTRQYVEGTDGFTMMIAYVEEGTTTAAWIYHPPSDLLLTATRHGGSRLNGDPITRAPASIDPADWSAALITGAMEPDRADRVQRRGQVIGHLDTSRHPAGAQYGRLLTGGVDLVVYWRTHPWDHAPGVLILREAGGAAARPDRRTYRPWGSSHGLVVAADPTTLDAGLALLAPAGQF